MRYTDSYKQLQEQFHVQCPEYGVSGHKWADHILDLSTKLKTRSILDYGAGKCTLQKALPFPIQNYDPFIPDLSADPTAADIVICTDVLEHIEPDCLHDVLADIQRLSIRMVFLEASTIPARKFLPDGRNAHLIQQPGNWWLSTFLQYFTIQSMTMTPSNSILIIGTQLQVAE